MFKAQLSRRLQGFFQPIAGEPYRHSSTKLPRQVELLHRAFNMTGDPAAMAGISRCVDADKCRTHAAMQMFCLTWDRLRYEFVRTTGICKTG